MIQISHLTKKFGKVAAVDDFSLAVGVPLFGFLGQNGAGKTTIMKIVMDFIRPTSGSILIDGMPWTDKSVRRKIGFMPENPGFYGRLTGLEFLKFCHELSGPLRKRKAADYAGLLKKTGIYDARDRGIGTYSKGMKQRLGIAQALIGEPEYVFLDEPLDGLDPVGRKEIKEVMRETAKAGQKIFFNTHILYDVEEICDELGVIERGHLLYSGPVKKFCGGMSLEDAFVKTVEAATAARAKQPA